MARHDRGRAVRNQSGRYLRSWTRPSACLPTEAVESRLPRGRLAGSGSFGLEDFGYGAACTDPGGDGGEAGDCHQGSQHYREDLPG
jgi:hypothetical protein